MLIRHICNLTAAIFFLEANALALPSSVSSDKALTSSSQLKNNIPLIIRETPGSDIVHLEINFASGTSGTLPNRRALNLLTLETMPYATKKFSKEKIYAMSEKYSFAVSCKGGVEISRCHIETIKDYLPQAVDLLTEIVINPIFSPEDVELGKKRRIADFKHETESPESRVNAVVNTVFYDASHPFRLLPEDGITQSESMTRANLAAYHKSILDAGIMSVVYAGPKLPKNILNDLEKTIGQIKKGSAKMAEIPTPVYSDANYYALEHREIPTAYIRLKFNAPSATSPDAEASEVLFEILSEKLHEEVRTKRSLSYAIHAGNVPYSQGIGMIAASTSKPKETLDTIASVIRDLKEKGISAEELQEYRNTFTTSYYLTMESHDSLAAALGTSQIYFNDAFKLYETPAKLNAVTPNDIKRLAGTILTKIRCGIVFDKEKFKSSWFDPIKKL
jgi:predicted Zn-dependent peptidase